MKLFRKASDYYLRSPSKRITLAYPSNGNAAALRFALDPSLLGKFQSLFFLDVNRSLTPDLIKQLDQANNPRELFVCEPKGLQDLQEACQEIQSYVQLMPPEQTVNVVLNNWETVWHLMRNSLGTLNHHELLLELKFLSDYGNILILQQSEHNWAKVLGDWANLELTMHNAQVLKIQASSFAEWVPGQTINLADQRTTEDVGSKPEEPLYEELVRRLSQVNDKDQLLEIRHLIQSNSEQLSVQERYLLSDIYKLHLQRVKLDEQGRFEDSDSIRAELKG